MRGSRQTKKGSSNGHGRRDTGRVPPHDLDAERALLGAALLSATALEVLAMQTQPGDFYTPAHQHIAHALVRCFQEKAAADAVTVADSLTRDGVLDVVGGLPGLYELQASTPSTSNAAAYAGIVHDHATLRRLVASAASIADLGYGTPADVHGAVMQAQSLVENVVANNGSRTYSSLRVADIEAIVAGSFALEQPRYLTRSDGASLLYAGKINGFQAEPSSGKSWLALLACVEALAMGGAAVYLDYEDTPVGIVQRLLALGATGEAVRSRFFHVRPDGALGLAEKVELGQLLDRVNPDVIVIDAVAEALSLDGYDEDRNAQVVSWFESVPKWLAETGACVLLLDHVTKDKEKRSRGGRGAGHKLAAIDGACYEVRVVKSFNRHSGGVLKLLVDKDKPGAVGAIRDAVAVVAVEPHADGARVEMRVDKPADSAALSEVDAWKPTRLMEGISKALTDTSAELTMSAIKATFARSRPKVVEEAVTRLVTEGYIGGQRRGRSMVYRSLRPYGNGNGNGNGSGPVEPAEPASQQPLDLSDEALFAGWDEERGE